MSVETSYALTATLIGVGVLVLVIAFILPRLVSENTEKKTTYENDELNVNSGADDAISEAVSRSPFDSSRQSGAIVGENRHSDRDRSAKKPRTRADKGNAA